MIFSEQSGSFDAAATGLLVSDLDGTLRHAGGIHTRATAALEALRAVGVVRAIATGRSLHSLRRVGELPVDVLIFSSGAGVLAPLGEQTPAPPSQPAIVRPTIIRRAGLAAEETQGAVELLLALGLDFMVHPPIPDEHRFAYQAAAGRDSNANPDFWRRVDLYRDSCSALGCSGAFGGGPLGPATQLLAVVPPDHGAGAYQEICERLPGLNVVRTTSPLDGHSMWIEIFSADVSKGQTVDWLARKLGLSLQDITCIGNDYNDLDMLSRGVSAFVTADAPPELRRRFAVVAAASEGGVADVADRWLADRQLGWPSHPRRLAQT